MSVAIDEGMREVIIPFSSTVSDEAGTRYKVRVIGRERADGIWEGRIEFTDDGGGRFSTGPGTTQPNRTDLEYWATGLEPIYMEGAFERARGAASGKELPKQRGGG